MTSRQLCLLMVMSAVLLTACDRDKGQPPAPTVSNGSGAASAVFTAPVPDPSMPTAATVAQGQARAPQDTASGARAPAALNRDKGAAWVPMAGQNNDHSAPLQPASAPSAAGTR